MDKERIEELLRVEELYDALTGAIVGTKMVPATQDQVAALATDAARYRWLRDEANNVQREVLNVPCGHTPDEPEWAKANARAVDAAVDAERLA